MGEIFSKYRIIEELGEGGMGKVYLVEAVNLKKKFAMKLCYGEEGCRERLQLKNEAERMKELDDRRYPYLVDYFEEEEMSALVMEYVSGVPLSTYIKKHIPFDEIKTLDILKKLTSLISYLHAQNPQVIYGDIKPDNFILTPEGEIRLIDFGTALSGYGEIRGGKLSGTPGYCPPEQLNGKSISAASDVYALGVTAVYMLTGADPLKPPYHAACEKDWPDMSAALRKLLMECTDRDPVKRPQDAGIMLRQLEKIRPVQHLRLRVFMGGLYKGLLMAAIASGLLMIRAAGLGQIYIGEEKIFFSLCGIIAAWRLFRSLRERRGGFIVKREWNVVYTEKEKGCLLDDVQG